MEFGDIPFARDAVVFHPPHRVNVERESRGERAKMFWVDSILFERHPDRYIVLAQHERHYRITPGFWHHFVRGLRESSARPPIASACWGICAAHDREWWSYVNSEDGGEPQRRHDVCRRLGGGALVASRERARGDSAGTRTEEVNPLGGSQPRYSLCTIASTTA